jgi:HAE1 family hydrophobic/amphiphilic exporter-1
VSGAVQDANVNLPTGILWGPSRSAAVMVNGQLQSAQEFGAVVVAYRNGAPVRVRDLGQVMDDVQSNKVASWFGDHRSITLAVQRQPGTNTVEVAGAVLEPCRRSSGSSNPHALTARVIRLSVTDAIHAAAHARAGRS